MSAASTASRRTPRVVIGALVALMMQAAVPAAAGPADQAALWAARDAETLRRAAPRLADSAISPVFDAMDQRVGAYADWVYGWFTSLLTAWDLAYVGAVESAREIGEGRSPDPGILHHRLASVVEERFTETVVLPERTAAQIASGWRRAMLRVARLDERLAADRRVRIARMAEREGTDPGPLLRSFGAPLLAPTLIDHPPPPDLAERSLTQVEDSAGGSADRVLIRSLRPLATRTISVTTRLFIAPLAGGIVAAPAAGANGAVSAIGALLAVSAGIWGFDYAVNEMDSAITRSGFEADLRALVRDAHARASRIARRHAMSAVCAGLGTPAGCLGLESVASPGRGG